MFRKFMLVPFLILLTVSWSGLRQNVLTQVAAIDALLAGYYDGVIPVCELLEYGNFGIGTFDKLDGEMILLDGIVYQFKADGKIYKPDGGIKTPFASVVNFNAGYFHNIKSISDYEYFRGVMDSLITNKNLFYSIKVSGLFKYIKTRSVPQQEKPYKPLNEVTKTQPIFERGNIFGTLVGFRLPQFTNGVSVPGYHMHFISADKSFGGHVLEFAAEDTDIEIMASASFYLLLPANEGSLGKIEVGKDRYGKLEGVEK